MHAKTTEKIQSAHISPEKAELKKDMQLQLVEEIKTAIHQLIYFSDSSPEQNISGYISKKVHHNYIFLNRLFSQSTGFTIKRYINTQKIELIKEILIYDNLNITVIAGKLNYRNASHLAEEFRKETGVSPALYRLLRKTRSYKYTNV
ncbi:MAG: AraC family transcriptional regulator [Prolixibacteraceae bacterium]